MEEQILDIRKYFAANWVFRLYQNKVLAYPVVILAVAAAIWLVGALFALLLGTFPRYASNVLAYGGPIGVGLALAAYGWFARTFPKTLAALYPALNTTQKEFNDVVKKWADRLANRLWIMILFSVPFAILSAIDIITLWTVPTSAWLGTDWVASNQAIFFAIYHGFNTVIAGAFLLGSGTVGILGSVLLLYELLKDPIKLAYYRELRCIGDFTIGLAAWTFVGFVEIAVVPILFKPNAASELATATIIQSVVGSAALLSALFTPIIFARQAIIRTKIHSIAGLAELQQGTYQKIERIKQELSTSAKEGTGVNADEEFKQLRTHLEHLETTNSLIRQIESISNWPITWRGTLQILGAAMSPIWGLLADTILPKITR